MTNSFKAQDKKRKFTEFTIADIGKDFGDAPFGTMLKTKDYTVSGVPVIQGRNIVGGVLKWNKRLYVSTEKHQSLPRSHVSKGDLVFPKIGTIGICAIAPAIEGFEKYLLSTNMMKMNVNEQIADINYIYYYFCQEIVKKYINNIAGGSSQPIFNFTTLKSLNILLPSIEIQKKVSFLIKPLDDLINIHEARIKLLEDIVQLMYREWFVEFRFPGYEKAKFVDSELGKIPEGWVVSSVSDVARISRGISYRSDNLVDKGIPFFTLNCLFRNGGFKFDGIKYFEGNYKESQLVKPNEIIIGVTDMTQARLIIGSVARIPSNGIEDGLISMDLVRAKSKKGFIDKYVYSMLRYSNFTRTIKEFANGANVLHLSPKHIEKFQFVLPNENARDRFVEIVSPIYKLMDNLMQINLLLAERKDLLLPKLMSGEIDVSKLDINITKN